MQGQLCLVSTSGDMAKNGMGNKNTVYLFNRKHRKSVDAFLKAQFKYSLFTLNIKWLEKKSVKKHLKHYLNTFRKLKDSDNFTTPISMLTLPKISFDTFSLDNHCAIDNFQYNVSENRYSLRMHVPDQSNFTDANLFNDIEVRRNFYEDKPKD